VPLFHITVVNDEFVSTNERECADVVAAREHAIGSTLDIASEQVKAGKAFFGAEVILREDGKEIARFVVSAGASMLKPAQ
jgi:hypothetical protein